MADRQDDLGALDFSYGGPTDVDDSDPLSFTEAESEAHDDLDALADYVPPSTEDPAADLDAIDSAAEATEESEDEDAVPLFTVINPPETVSVSASMDGSIQRVDLSPKATAMTAEELAAEIIVLAELARQKGLAGQHAFIMEQAAEMDEMRDAVASDRDGLSEFLSNSGGLNLPTLEQAAAAEAEVFATRYAGAD